MSNNEINFVDSVKDKLKEIKECTLDIAILRRNLDEFSNKNVIERNDKKYTIEDLTSNIEKLEVELEKDLIASKGAKIDTRMGYVSFREIQDEWIYDVPKIMESLKTMPENITKRFIRTTIDLLQGELKKAIMADNPGIFEKSKIIDLGAKLYLVGIDDDYQVKGIEIKRQDPRFHYKIKVND